ncbi:MAG: DNA-protecting protein DprA [Candidatus Omnitrophica bacterium]|nr:DNA-protecting protein DprA [Candidatus Omnitrophota bacterium]
MDEREAIVALNAVCGLGNARIRKLIEVFGSAQTIFRLKRQDIEASGIITDEVIGNLLSFDADSFIKKEFQLLAKAEADFVVIGDHGYPGNLNNIPDKPAVIYFKGIIPETIDMSLAVVGSRSASFYGLSLAKEFSSRLAELGFVVISGMARGIDSSAHWGVINSGGTTVAVLGSGLNVIYPPENKDLFERISEQGCVFSEFPMAATPQPYNFPRRNRIISGLSLGVLIVEAALRSGALITADFALEQGRDVFAIPGKIDNPTAKGVNELIKQGAKLITCVEDIIHELKVPLVNLTATDKKEIKGFTSPVILDNLSESEIAVFNVISTDPIRFENVSEAAKLNLSETSAALLNLELKKMIKQMPGKMFVR